MERLDLSISRSISRMENYYSRVLNKILNSYATPLSVKGYMLLWNIEEEQGVTQYQLAKISGHSPPRCNQLVKQLEEQELIMRINDEYGKIKIGITESGRQVLSEVSSRVDRTFIGFLKEDEIKEITNLNDTLDRVSRMMQANNALQKYLRS